MLCLFWSVACLIVTKPFSQIFLAYLITPKQDDTGRKPKEVCRRKGGCFPLPVFKKKLLARWCAAVAMVSKNYSTTMYLMASTNTSW